MTSRQRATPWQITTAALALVSMILGVIFLVVYLVRGTKEGTANPPPSSSTAATTTSSSTATTPEVCQFVNDAAYQRVLTEAVIIAREKGSALRADVATTYNGFAAGLFELAPMAPRDLRLALVEWASASGEVARFVSGNEPGPGIVIDYGPAHPRWKAARKAAEDLCGHPLPNTG